MTDTGVFRTPPIRYATAERFAPPRPVDPGAAPSGGEICPQPPSRLDAVMGRPHDSHPFGEDCLNLTVTTPGGDRPRAEGRARPVMVWFHGGGFSSGAGLREWYDGGALSAQGDVVVVSVNYRLGALGYLCGEGVSEGNLGLLDQLEALRWVHRHIAGHGGDPHNVTVFGQSAGALSIRLLLDVPEARGLFHRAILQSAPLPSASKPREEAEPLGRLFAERLGGDPRTAGVEDLLRAQQEVAAAHAQEGGSVDPPFIPVTGAPPLTSPGASGDDLRGLDLLYGWNADDATAFTGPGGDPDGRLTQDLFAGPLGDFADRARKAGARVHRYRLDWRPAGSPYGATHCVELPLLLGSRAAWEGSPMLGDTPWEDVDAFGATLRAAWTGFAHTGTPDVAHTEGRPVDWELDG